MFWKKIDKIERILEESIKETDKRLDRIEKVMIIQESNLDKHMERSSHLESIIEKMEETDLRPLRRHVSMVEGGLKLLGILGLIITMLGGVIKLLSLI